MDKSHWTRFVIKQHLDQRSDREYMLLRSHAASLSAEVSCRHPYPIEQCQWKAFHSIKRFIATLAHFQFQGPPWVKTRLLRWLGFQTRGLALLGNEDSSLSSSFVTQEEVGRSAFRGLYTGYNGMYTLV